MISFTSTFLVTCLAYAQNNLNQNTLFHSVKKYKNMSIQYRLIDTMKLKSTDNSF